MPAEHDLSFELSQADIDLFQADGALVLRGLLEARGVRWTTVVSAALAAAREGLRRPLGRRLSGEAVSDGVGGDGCGGSQAELTHEIRAVLLDRLVAERHQLGHLARAIALGDERDDFLLAA